jgi:low temperature requirement protein LtrA
MSGRDPHETHRAATPLELLFDLTFATCFSLAASQYAQVLAEGRYTAALAGFAFASFAICWAWMNFSWFSSAYDTDDWVFRVVTMVQMIGVLVLAIGLQPMFASLERGQRLDNSIMVLGYVIMRVALLFQWLRAAAQDRARRRACVANIITITVAQFGWVALIAFPFSAPQALALGTVLALIEFAGPLLAEYSYGGTPWNAYHIAERYSLFAIIAMGEAIVGTVAALSAIVGRQGWTLDAALVGVAGTGLTFGMWWIYELVPSAQILQRHRRRAFVWSFFQTVVVTAIVAVGAGLRVSASFLEQATRMDTLTTLLAVAIPLSVFLVSLWFLYYYLVRRFGAFDGWLLVASGSVIAAAIVAALFGITVAKCLVILVLSPTIIIVAYESQGYGRQALP